MAVQAIAVLEGPLTGCRVQASPARSLRAASEEDERKIRNASFMSDLGCFESGRTVNMRSSDILRRLAIAERTVLSHKSFSLAARVD